MVPFLRLRIDWMVRTDNNRVIDKYIMIKPIETSVDTVRGIDGYQIHRVVTENVVNESDFPD
jgi:hypothetical protein